MSGKTCVKCYIDSASKVKTYIKAYIYFQPLNKDWNFLWSSQLFGCLVSHLCVLLSAPGHS